MPAVKVNIKPEIISWVLRQTQEEKLGEKLMNNITKWLNGTKTPTFHQIEDFSKKANIPLGYFFLQTPPEEQIDLLGYRTVDSIQLANPSRNLIDTIHEMENIQDWMKDYRQELGFDVLPFVGCMKGIREERIIVDQIRKDLGLDEIWYEQCRDAREAFSYIRGRLEACGVIVMMSGVVGKNTHRVLDVDEFQGICDGRLLGHRSYSSIQQILTALSYFLCYMKWHISGWGNMTCLMTDGGWQMV